MLQKDYPVVFPDYILTQEELSPDKCLFFDIETTGLSWKNGILRKGKLDSQAVVLPETR